MAVSTGVQHGPCRKAHGFSLVELMVVVTVVGILAAVVYPSYVNYVLRSNRVDGREILQRVAAAQERFYTNRNRYTEDITGATGLAMTNVSEKGFYTVRVSLEDGDQSFFLRAAPQGRQTNDQCSVLTLTNVGTKSFNGNESNGSCW